jgi:hypothetical protein
MPSMKQRVVLGVLILAIPCLTVAAATAVSAMSPLLGSPEDWEGL